MPDFGMQVSQIVLTSRINDEKYNTDGKRALQLGFKAVKGKVFVFALLGTMSPSEVTPEWVSKQLKRMAKAKWEKTKGSL